MSGQARPLNGPTVLLFGSLALSFNDAAFAKLRDDVLQRGDLHWMFELVTELPGCWEAITNALPNLKAGTSLEQLDILKRAFVTGEALDLASPLPNTLLIPLVVISHLVEYVSFLENENVDYDENIDIFATSKPSRETIGLCTGLLSAFAVSSAGNKEQFRKYGSVAVRLGLLIGVVVDSQNITSRAEAVSTAWNSSEGKEEILRVLERFPEVSQSLPAISAP